jgi:VWFA-related protein
VPATLVAGLALAPAFAQETPTFGAGVELVTVDAVVLDDEGGPVAGLRAEDFELRDEGEPREILSFESLDQRAAPVRLSREERRVATNVDASPGRVVAVLWDDARISPLAAEDARRGLRAWLLARLRQGDRVVLAATSGLWHVADGMEGREALLRAVDGLHGRWMDGPDREHVGDYEALQIAFRDDAMIYGLVRRRFEAQGVPGCGSLFSGGPGGGGAPSGNLTQPIPRNDPCPVLPRATETARQARDRLRATLAALERLCEVLAVARGRKSVVLVSHGFPQDPGYGDEFEAVARAAHRANAVVTLLDPVGFSVTPGMSATVRGAPVASDGAVARAVLQAEQAGAERVALETGGTVVRTNDLPDGLERIARESETHYLLGFAPAPGAEAGAFREISVKVRRPGLNVRARRGYTVGPEPGRAAEDELRRVLDAPFELGAHPVRVAAWVFEPRPPEASRIVLGVDVAFPAAARGPGGQQSRLDLFVEVQGGERRWRQDKELVFQPPDTREDAAKQLWYLALLEFDLPPGAYRARVVAREKDGSGFGAVAHAFDVPEVDTWRLSTPLLSASVLVAADGQTAVPVPTTRREFGVDGALHGQFAVYGTPGRPGSDEASRLSGGWSLHGLSADAPARSGSLTVVATGNGAAACQFSVPLQGMAVGDYELVLRVRDEEAGRELESTEPVRLTAALGSGNAPRVGASVPEGAAPSGGGDEVDPELARLLEKAGRYVVDYEQAFSNVVAEETYTQWVGALGAGGKTRGIRRQITRADLVFVRLDNEFLWGSFRDVFEVDGQPVRDREARLERLFLEPTSTGLERAREILQESAAYNIGPAIRTVNLPTLPLAFLHPRIQPRFSFERKGRRRIAGVEGVEIRFEETGRPTLVRGEESSDLPATGRFWVDPERGTVLRSETRFTFPPSRARASVATEYRPEPALALWVPSEMREEYEDIPGSSWPLFRTPSEATAQYSNYRRFGVAIDEKARLPEAEEP